MVTQKLVRAQVVTSIPQGAIGTYFLGKANNPLPLYVGRSDRGLRRRLLQHVARGKFDWFMANITESTRQAYYLECRGWHSLRDWGIKNLIHPAAPGGLPMGCPFCSFVRSMSDIRYNG